MLLTIYSFATSFNERHERSIPAKLGPLVLINCKGKGFKGKELTNRDRTELLTGILKGYSISVPWR